MGQHVILRELDIPVTCDLARAKASRDTPEWTSILGASTLLTFITTGQHVALWELNLGGEENKQSSQPPELPDNVLKTETGTGTGRGSNLNRTGTGNEPVEPVSMNRFFKKYIKYLNFNEKNIFLRF
jgi:hypothetical protein